MNLLNEEQKNIILTFIRSVDDTTENNGTIDICFQSANVNVMYHDLSTDNILIDTDRLVIVNKNGELELHTEWEETHKFEASYEEDELEKSFYFKAGDTEITFIFNIY